jgi:hypothetical protein
MGCLVFIFSCQKRNDNPPKVEFFSPVHYQNLALGDAIIVDIDIWDEQEIDSYELSLSSESGFEYFQDKKDIHKAFYRISYEFDLSISEEQKFNITVKVKDNDGNSTKRSILVTID